MTGSEKNTYFKKPQSAPKAKPKAPEKKEVKKSTMERLQELKARMEKEKKSTMSDKERWGGRRATMDLNDWQKPKKPEAVKAMKEFIRWETPPEEVDAMQRAQELIYSHYLNPNFTLYINLYKAEKGKGSFADKIFSTLDKVIEHPDHFRYAQSKGEGDTLIITSKDWEGGERLGEKERDISIRLEGGFIRRIQAKGLDQIFSVGEGESPWMDGKNYQQEINGYTYTLRKQFKESPLLKQIVVQAKSEGWDRRKTISELQRALPQALDPSLMEIAAENHQRYIKKLKNLMDKRGFGFEVMEPAYETISRLAAQTSGMPYVLRTTPEIRGAYVIQPQGTSGIENAIVVTREGYLMIRNANGWVVDPRYPDRIKNRYYETHPKDKAQLSSEAQQTLETQAQDRATQAEELKQGEKIQKISDKIAKITDIKVLKAIIKLLDPTENVDVLDKIKKEDIPKVIPQIIKQIQNALPKALDKIDELEKLMKDQTDVVETAPTPTTLEGVRTMISSMEPKDYKRYLQAAIKLARSAKDEKTQQDFLIKIRDIHEKAEDKISSLKEVFSSMLDEENFTRANEFINEIAVIGASF